jgi:hypothetical protein
MKCYTALIIGMISISTTTVIHAQEEDLIDLLTHHQNEALQAAREVIVDTAAETMRRRVADAKVAWDEAIMEWMDLHGALGFTLDYERSFEYGVLLAENTRLWRIDGCLQQAVRAAEDMLTAPPETNAQADAMAATCDNVGNLADVLRDRAVDFAEIIRTITEILNE